MKFLTEFLEREQTAHFSFCYCTLASRERIFKSSKTKHIKHLLLYINHQLVKQQYNNSSSISVGNVYWGVVHHQLVHPGKNKIAPYLASRSSKTIHKSIAYLLFRCSRALIHTLFPFLFIYIAPSSVMYWLTYSPGIR